MSLPAGWIQIQDPATGRPYYFNQQTRETTWTPPQPQQQHQGSSTVPPPPPPMSAPPTGPGQQPQLPPGWEMAFDGKSGKYFYIDHNTKRTQWNPPQPQFAYNPAVLPYQSQMPGAAAPASASAPVSAPAMWQSQPIPQPQQQQPIYYSPYGGVQPLQPQPQLQPQLQPPMMYSQIAPVAPVLPPGVIAHPAAMAPAMLCTSPASWTAPLASDLTNCPKCGVAFSLFKRKHNCKCCTRDFCDSCSQKKGAFPTGPARVCDSCYAHFSRNERRCFCRLVPYLTDPKEEARSTALTEAADLVAASVYTPEEVAGSGIVRGLKGFVTAGTPRQGTLAATVLSYALRHNQGIEQLLSDAPYAKLLLSAVDRDDANAETFVPALVAVAGNEKGRTTLLEGKDGDTLRVCSKLLTSARKPVAAGALRTMELLSAGGKALGADDAESAAVFAVVPLAGGAEATPAVRASAIALICNLADRPHNRLAMNQCDGIAVLVKVLSTPPSVSPPTAPSSASPPEPTPEADARNAVAALRKIATQEECAGAVAAHLAEIVAVADTTAVPGVAQEAFAIVARLSAADATQRNVNQSVLLDHMHAIVKALASADAATKVTVLEIVLSLLSTHPEIAGGIFHESKVIPAIAGVVRERGPSASVALKAFAISAQNNPSAEPGLADLGVAEVALELLARGDAEAATALWSLTAHRSLAQRVAAQPALIPTVLGIVSKAAAAAVPQQSAPSPAAPATPASAATGAAPAQQSAAELKLVGPVCGMVANLCSRVPGFAMALPASGMLQPLATMLTGPAAANSELHVHALVTIGAIAAADPRAADAVSSIPVVMQAIFAHITGNVPATRYNALSAVAAIAAASALFRSEFIRNNGIKMLMNTVTGPSDEHIKERTAAALVSFAAAGEGERAVLRAEKFLPLVADLLFSAPPPVKVHAAAAAAAFAAGAVPQDAAELVGLGAVMGLVGLLSDAPDVLRETAAHALGGLLKASRDCAKAALDSGVLGPTALIGLLESEGDGLRREGLWLLAGLLAFQPAVAEFAKSAGLKALVNLTREAATKDAALALVLVVAASTPDAMRLFAESAGLGAVVALWGSTNQEIQTRSLEHVAKMAADPDVRREVVAAGGVAVLATALASKSPAVLASAASILASLSDVPEVREAIADRKVSEPLLALALTAAAGTDDACSSALSALSNVASVPAATELLSDPASVKGLGALLCGANTGPKSRRGAVVLLTHAAGSNPSVAALVVEAGCIPAVIALLVGDPIAATDALSLLTVCSVAAPSARAAVMQDAQAVPVLVAMSAPSSPTQLCALTLLSNLCEEDSFRARTASLDVTPLVAVVCAIGSSPEAVDHALYVLASACRSSGPRKQAAESSCVEALLSIIASADSAPSLVSSALLLVSQLCCSEQFRGSVLAAQEKWMPALASAVSAGVPAAFGALSHLAVSEGARALISSNESLQAGLLAAAKEATPAQSPAIRVLASVSANPEAVLRAVFTAAFGSAASRCSVARLMLAVPRDALVAFFAEDSVRVALLCSVISDAPQVLAAVLPVLVTLAHSDVVRHSMVEALKEDTLIMASRSSPILGAELDVLASLVGSP